MAAEKWPIHCTLDEEQSPNILKWGLEFRLVIYTSTKWFPQTPIK